MEAFGLTHKQSLVNLSASARNLSNGLALQDNRVRNLNNSNPIQRRTLIKNTGQNYTYGRGVQKVGRRMEAWLDPTDPVKGQKAEINTSQKRMMTAIRRAYGLTGGEVVKGHLLNDNLGGSALSVNLYPITRAANSAHLNYVENFAKRFLWGRRRHGIYYEVEVIGRPSIANPRASFFCRVKSWNHQSGRFTRRGMTLLSKSINSDLGDHGSYQAYHDVDEHSRMNRGREDNPVRPYRIGRPSARVGALSTVERQYRNDDNRGRLPNRIASINNPRMRRYSNTYRSKTIHALF